jgi:putative SOS response-associated peptidase YedK
VCGRFVQYSPLETLQNVFSVGKVVFEAVPNYNVAPSQNILAVVKHDNKNKLERLYWGLVPFWAKDVSIGSRMINARLETVSEKPSFRNAFKKRRCLIPADGFYEWKGEPGHKQPFFVLPLQDFGRLGRKKKLPKKLFISPAPLLPPKQEGQLVKFIKGCRSYSCLTSMKNG